MQPFCESFTLPLAQTATEPSSGPLQHWSKGLKRWCQLKNTNKLGFWLNVEKSRSEGEPWWSLLVNHSGHHGASSQVMWAHSVHLCALVVISGAGVCFWIRNMILAEPPSQGFPAEKSTFHFQGLKAPLIAPPPLNDATEKQHEAFYQKVTEVIFIRIFNTDWYKIIW